MDLFVEEYIDRKTDKELVERLKIMDEKEKACKK